MATFTEESAVDTIRVAELGVLEIRRVDKVLRDGVTISQEYHRHVLAPGDPLDNEDSKVVAVAQIVWTPEVIQAWHDSLASEQPA
ncbi:hypothetical protein SAZ10_00465 [Mesorhizobium sp. BAC0120]|uniref:hypothetical protein n=1 Tax=Mesorhizobium sp. BAC0120 TaxID=3090670 RepID=UPI00298C01C8|nr:hypothetical protein [Mesorhizobium sp. BAC0120]MDW6020228.1 hypothetical protein [Mesorhizobium sp. BAC0120]